MYLQNFLDPTWRSDDVRRHVSQVLPILEASGEERGVAGAIEALANARLAEGTFDGLEEMIRRVIDHATRAGDIREESTMRAHLCAIGLWGPTPVPEIIDRCRQTLAWAERAPGSEGCAGRVQRVLGLLEAMVGRFQDARRSVSRSSEIFQSLGLLPSQTVTRIFAGEIEILARLPDVADGILREALAGADALGVYGGGVTVRLAEVALMRGRIDEADQFIVESGWQFISDRDNAAEWRATRARVLARLGRLAEADTVAREAVALVEGTGYLVTRAGAHRALAEVLQEAGRGEEARVEYERALVLFEQKGDLVRAAMVRDSLALPDYRRAEPESAS
jgi:tetratricopeptide (TPR) repeat protein